jgi:hypothetical protein
LALDLGLDDDAVAEQVPDHGALQPVLGRQPELKVAAPDSRRSTARAGSRRFWT